MQGHFGHRKQQGKGLAEISCWCSPSVWLWVYSELREERIGPKAELELSGDSLQGGLCVPGSPGSSWACCLKIADPVQLLLGSRRSGMVRAEDRELGNWGWIVWLYSRRALGVRSSVSALHRGEQSWATKTRVQLPVQPWARHFTSLPQFPHLENGDNNTHLPHRGVVRTHKLL